MYFSKVVDDALLKFQRLNLSFINTNPIYDLGFLVCLTPLWWILGIESFAYPIGSFLILLKVVTLRKGKLMLPSTLKWIFVFLLVYMISGVFIVESFRWITFIRNFTVFLTVFSITSIVVNSVKDWADIRFLVKVIVIIAGISAFFGVLGILNIWRPNIISQLGKLLPEWIASTNYGQTIVFRKFGNNAYYQLVGTYFRVKSIFAYSILYASALAFTIPIVVYFHQINHNSIKRFILKIIVTLLLINLVFTTGRIAIIGLIIGFLYFILIVSRKTRSLRIPIFLLITLFVVLFLAISFINFDELLANEEISDITYFLFYGRGASTGQRVFVYQETLKGWLQRPLFGWGTERDILDFKYPAGSHSFYFGLLYRQGIIGLFVFAMVMFSLWRLTRPMNLIRPNDRNFFYANKLLEYGRWVYIVAIVDAITTDPIIDILTMSILWLIFSTLISAKQVLYSRWRNQLTLETL